LKPGQAFRFSRRSSMTAADRCASHG
jgi:hypothetical protein